MDNNIIADIGNYVLDEDLAAFLDERIQQA